jgi:hypothetical protein
MVNMIAVIAAGVIFGKELATRLVRSLDLAEGEARGIGSARSNPPIPTRRGGRLYGKLDGDLDCNDPAATATMSIWEWNGSADADSGRDETVCVPFASKLGYILAGHAVEVEWSLGASSYMVVAGGKARWIVATADTAWDGSNATITGTVIEHWGDPDGDPGTSVTLEHTAAMFFGDLGASIICSYDPAMDQYKMVVPSCPAPTS